MSSFEMLKTLPELQAFPALQTVLSTSPSYGKAMEEINRAYRQGEPVVSDEIYDSILLPALADVDPQHAFLSEVEPEPLDDATLVRHENPMLSTDKAYSQQEVDAYLSRVSKAALLLGINPDDLTFRATAKLDGIAGNDTNGRLVTRGDGLQGNDITHVFNQGVVVEGDRGMGRGELVCGKTFFNTHLGPDTAYAMEDSRSFVAGFVGADTLKEHHRLALDAQAIRFVPFSTLPEHNVTLGELRDNWLNLYYDIPKESPFDTDGIVVAVNNRRLHQAMGATAHHERGVLAIKQISETAVTSVLDIRLTTGRTGRIIPTLIVNPARLSGATVSKVTAHTANNLVKLGLGVGARVEITRSGM